MPKTETWWEFKRRLEMRNLTPGETRKQIRHFLEESHIPGEDQHDFCRRLEFSYSSLKRFRRDLGCRFSFKGTPGAEHLKWQALREGLTVGETAKRLGLSRNAIYSWSYRNDVRFKSERPNRDYNRTKRNPTPKPHKKKTVQLQKSKVMVLSRADRVKYDALRKDLGISHIEALRRMVAEKERVGA